MFISLKIRLFIKEMCKESLSSYYSMNNEFICIHIFPYNQQNINDGARLFKGILHQHMTTKWSEQTTRNTTKTNFSYLKVHASSILFLS